jgi:hypothetical protein
MRRDRNEIPHEPLPKKRRTVESSILAFHDEVTFVSYVPKRNRTVIALSTECHGAKLEVKCRTSLMSLFNIMPQKMGSTP